MNGRGRRSESEARQSKKRWDTYHLLRCRLRWWQDRLKNRYMIWGDLMQHLSRDQQLHKMCWLRQKAQLCNKLLKSSNKGKWLSVDLWCGQGQFTILLTPQLTWAENKQTNKKTQDSLLIMDSQWLITQGRIQNLLEVTQTLAQKQSSVEMPVLQILNRCQSSQRQSTPSKSAINNQLCQMLNLARWILSWEAQAICTQL